MPAEEAKPVTVLAHTGDEAQLTRSRGALSFRFGDFFSANDREQMRLTEEGNLGIGTTRAESEARRGGDDSGARRFRTWLTAAFLERP